MTKLIESIPISKPKASKKPTKLKPRKPKIKKGSIIEEPKKKDNKGFMKLIEENKPVSKKSKQNYDAFLKTLNEEKPKNDTTKLIDDTLSMIYSNKKGTRDFDKLVEKWREKRKFFDIILTSDFYPTPLHVSSLIKKDVDKSYKNYNLYDISAGLASLSRAFIEDPKNIKHITLLEYEEEFVNLLKGYIKTNKKIEVIHKDFFDYDLKLSQKDESVVLCNPPFTGRLNKNNEAQFWLYFVVKILNEMNNIYIQTAYFILPKSNLFKRNGKSLQYVESEIDQQCELDLPKAIEKRVNAYFNIDYYSDIPLINYFTYLGNISGFKGIDRKSLNTRSSPDCALFRVGS
jgi:predicted RNA methylase